MSDARRWLTTAEAAQLYGWHPKSVLALCARRRIPHVRLPSVRGGRGQIRIDRVALDRQLEANLVQPAPAEPLDRRKIPKVGVA